MPGRAAVTARDPADGRGGVGDGSRLRSPGGRVGRRAIRRRRRRVPGGRLPPVGSPGRSLRPDREFREPRAPASTGAIPGGRRPAVGPPGAALGLHAEPCNVAAVCRRPAKECIPLPRMVPRGVRDAAAEALRGGGDLGASGIEVAGQPARQWRPCGRACSGPIRWPCWSGANGRWEKSAGGPGSNWPDWPRPRRATIRFSRPRPPRYWARPPSIWPCVVNRLPSGVDMSWFNFFGARSTRSSTMPRTSSW